MDKLKREVLQKFDENVQKEDSFNQSSGGSGFLMEFVSKLIEKFVLRIFDIDIVFIY